MPQTSASIHPVTGDPSGLAMMGKKSREETLHVVLVDDDDLFRESLRLNLVDEGLAVTDFAGGAGAIEFFVTGGHADVLLLDWKMPGMDGLEVLRRLRRASILVPTIFLTVLSDQVYEEAALAGGAVDFIEKSRSFSIVMRRVELIVSGRKLSGTPAEQETNDIIRYGHLQLRPESKRAHWKGIQIELTRREYDIVELLAERTGRDVTYREIYDSVHGSGFHAGYGAEGYRANVRTFIKRIRRKFRDADGGFEAIENFAGFGYRWRADL